MDRAQKAESIETLKGVFADAGAVVVTHNLGLTVADMEDLRGRRRCFDPVETAVAGPDPRLALGPHQRSRDQDRRCRSGARRPAGPGVQRLRHQGRGVSLIHLRTPLSNPILRRKLSHG